MHSSHDAYGSVCDGKHGARRRSSHQKDRFDPILSRGSFDTEPSSPKTAALKSGLCIQHLQKRKNSLDERGRNKRRARYQSGEGTVAIGPGSPVMGWLTDGNSRPVNIRDLDIPADLAQTFSTFFLFVWFSSGKARDVKMQYLEISRESIHLLSFACIRS
ncbi:hypothetical protein HNY73_001624 [Argiope bruennichi]|uniref:Uncharacterized protein n=1 Tax=Argiope bruennichi TaxID=94029 RepID=A0A8T0FRX3_ARGBR|nr:hypothetical protein HNY73_001624 [Argiope bruennichi]